LCSADCVLLSSPAPPSTTTTLVLATLATRILSACQCFAGTNTYGTRNLGNSVDKFCTENHIGIVEHAFFQRHNNELALREMSLEHIANILSMRQVERRVNLHIERKIGSE